MTDLVSAGWSEELVSMHRRNMTLPFAKRTLLLLRNHTAAITLQKSFGLKHRSIQPLQLGRNAQRLRFSVIHFPADIIAQLTPAEQEERRQAALTERSNIFNSYKNDEGENEADIQVSGAEQTEWIDQFKRFVDYPNHSQDAIQFEMQLWCGFHLLRRHCLYVYEHDRLELEDLDINELDWVNMIFTHGLGRDPSLQLMPPLTEAEMNELTRARGEDLQAAHAYDMDWEYWLQDVSEIYRRRFVRLPQQSEARIERVMQLYPEVGLEQIAPGAECSGCFANFGYDDEQDPPRRSTCCPPFIIGAKCLVIWLVDNEESTCPNCRADLNRTFKQAMPM